MEIMELRGRVRRASSLTDEEISKMCWEQIRPLVDFEYNLLLIRKEKEKVIKAANSYQHYLELSEGNSKIAKRVFMESGFGAYWEDVCEELKNRKG